MDKGGAKKEPEPKINNFGSATLLVTNQNDCVFYFQIKLNNFLAESEPAPGS